MLFRSNFQFKITDWLSGNAIFSYILGKKVKDEDEIMLGHLKWVESQIQLLEQSEKQNEERKKKIHIEFENKRKERMLLDEAFQEVINNGDLDKLKEYHSSYIELEIYFENVSDEYECYGRVLEEYEYSLCREKIEGSHAPPAQRAWHPATLR